MALNDFGAVLTSLLPVVKKATEKAHENFYGTQRYFIERNLSVHRAFEKWCVTHGLEQRASEIRDLLKKHIETYQISEAYALEPLFKSMPDEFNVRGQWTPEH